MKPNKIIGLTGGIASGKSTVSAYLKSKQYPVFDADQSAKRVLSQGSDAYMAVVSHFGPSILGVQGEIDRKKLGRIIFSKEKERLVLNQIIHPHVFEAAKMFIQKKEGLIFLDMPLLFETLPQAKKEGLYFEQIVLVFASQEIQLCRLMARDGLGQKEAMKKIKAQMPLMEKLKLADIILYNDKDLEDLYRQADEMLRILTV